MKSHTFESPHEYLLSLALAIKEGRLLILEGDGDPLSLDGLALYLQNRADATGELNDYDKMLLREASFRLAEAWSAGRWFSATEEPPEIGEDVLMQFEHGMAVGFRHDCDGKDETGQLWRAYADDGYYTDCDVAPLFWRRLPERQAGGDAK